MDRTDDLKELTAALVAAQAQIQPAVKDADNPHFGHKFADLAAIWAVARGPLTGQGLAVTQAPEQAEGGAWVLRTTLLHTSGAIAGIDLALALRPPQHAILGVGDHLCSPLRPGSPGGDRLRTGRRRQRRRRRDPERPAAVAVVER